MANTNIVHFYKDCSGAVYGPEDRGYAGIQKQFRRPGRQVPLAQHSQKMREAHERISENANFYKKHIFSGCQPSGNYWLGISVNAAAGALALAVVFITMGLVSSMAGVLAAGIVIGVLALGVLLGPFARDYGIIAYHGLAKKIAPLLLNGRNGVMPVKEIEEHGVNRFCYAALGNRRIDTVLDISLWHKELEKSASGMGIGKAELLQKLDVFSALPEKVKAALSCLEEALSKCEEGQYERIMDWQELESYRSKLGNSVNQERNADALMALSAVNNCLEVKRCWAAFCAML